MTLITAFTTTADCQNNTFMALRIVGDPHDVVLSHYYSTGNNYCNKAYLIILLFAVLSLAMFIIDTAPPIPDQLYFQEYYNITQV